MATVVPAVFLHNAHHDRRSSRMSAIVPTMTTVVTVSEPDADSAAVTYDGWTYADRYCGAYEYAGA